MKSVKYIISFCILFVGFLIIGESHTFRLNNFYTEFHNTTLYLQQNTTEQEMIKDTLHSADRNNIELFTFVKSTPSAFQTEYEIYGTSGVEPYINDHLDIYEKEYPSLFLEDIRFKFHDLATIQGLDKIHEFYVIGSSEQAEKFKVELINKYAGNFPKEGYVSNDARNTIIGIWLLIISIILLLSYYDVIFQKRENLIRVSMGEPISKIIWRNILADSFVFIFLFAMIVTFLAPITSVFFGFKISLFLFAVLIISNALLYINLYFYKLKEVFSNAKGGSRKLLSLNYGLKLVTVMITIFVISSNVAVMYESYQLYKQKSFFVDHSDYSYIRLNYRLVINSDGSITDRMDEDKVVQTKFYKEFFRNSNAIVLSDTDGLSNGNGIIANRNAFDYLSSEIKELKGLSLNKDIYFLVPKQLSGNAVMIDSLKESVRFFEGDLFTYDYDIVYYEEDVELISIEVNEFNGSQFQTNPLIVYNNLSADKIENQVVDKEWGIWSFTDEIMFKITDDEFNQFVQENGLIGEIVKKTNVLDKYNHSWNVAKRVLIINFIFSMLVLFLEFIIITSIIKLEYEVNAIELSIKKVQGHSMLAKNSKIILMTLITTLLSIGAAVTTAILMKLDQVYYLASGGIVILLLELAVISFYIRIIEKIKIQKILKGGNI